MMVALWLSGIYVSLSCWLLMLMMSFLKHYVDSESLPFLWMLNIDDLILKSFAFRF